MIRKDAIQKIIEENNKTENETKELRIGGNNLSWSESRIALGDYIARLHTDDFVDLLALLDYGRDICHMQKQGTYEGFLQKRESLCINNLSDEERRQKAQYLLKNMNLSRYLGATLPLFDEESFIF